MPQLITIKREIERFIRRFIFSGNKTIEKDAELLYILTDLNSFIEKEIIKISQKIIDQGFNKSLYIPTIKKNLIEFKILNNELGENSLASNFIFVETNEIKKEKENK